MRLTLNLARMVAIALGYSALAGCGGSTSTSGDPSGSGGAGLDASAGAGGSSVGSGGESAAGGANGTGGGGRNNNGGSAGDRVTGTGGTTTLDASRDTSFCWSDAGKLVDKARACTGDGDCAILVDPHCCGASGAVGVTKTEKDAFAPCFALPPNACQGLGCASYLGYSTDTGKTTQYDPSFKNQLEQVTVRCQAMKCTTDVIEHADAGHD